MSDLGIFVSNGSACSSGDVKPSRVISALGENHYPENSIRIGLLKTVSDSEIDFATDKIIEVVKKLKQGV